MNYTEKSFSGCVFNPLTTKKMQEAYPRINDIIGIGWHGDENLDALIRYTVMMYDPNSPLLKDEADLNYRKAVAADMAGLGKLGDNYLVKLFSFKQPLYITELVIGYLRRFVRTKEYAAIAIIENCFWESALKLLEPITGDNSKAQLEAVQKKSAIKDELDKDQERLKKLRETFFGGDQILESVATNMGTPESMARMLSNEE